MKKRLNIIGCGNVGKTLARLWALQDVFDIGDILNRSSDSSRAAVEFIGAGRVAASLERMNSADVFLIGTPDDRIMDSCSALADSGVLVPQNIVLHCSGSLPSAGLMPAKKAGAWVASVHPVKSFADPDISASSFTGTFCGVEGDGEALAVVRPAFESIGGNTFSINPEEKTIYHAANVVVCNYLAALMEFGIKSYSKAGLDRKTAMQVMEPIVRGTVDNIFTLGTAQALTGPIARGDHAVVARQLDAISDWQPRLGNLYRDLGILALELSRQKGGASSKDLHALAGLLE